MRSRILTAFLVAVSLAPAWSARAQDAQDQEEAEGCETEGADVAEEEGSGKVRIPGRENARESAPGWDSWGLEATKFDQVAA